MMRRLMRKRTPLPVILLEAWQMAVESVVSLGSYISCLLPLWYASCHDMYHYSLYLWIPSIDLWITEEYKLNVEYCVHVVPVPRVVLYSVRYTYTTCSLNSEFFIFSTASKHPQAYFTKLAFLLTSFLTDRWNHHTAKKLKLESDAKRAKVELLKEAVEQALSKAFKWYDTMVDAMNI